VRVGVRVRGVGRDGRRDFGSNWLDRGRGKGRGGFGIGYGEVVR
jgi:hypothetical protein